MPIQVSCNCGRSLRVKDELAGRKVRCPGCEAVLPVPKPSVDPEEEALNLLLSEGPEDRPARSRAPDPVEREEEEERPRARAPQMPRPLTAETKPTPAPKPKKPPREREREKSRIVINPEIITGLLMMAGAAIWFFAGLAAGYIYFYPPILFILGIGAIIRGFTGSD